MATGAQGRGRLTRSAEFDAVVLGAGPAGYVCAIRLAQLGKKVAVVGYPVGGEELSITEGVVSRIEVQRYSHSQRHLLAVTENRIGAFGNTFEPGLFGTVNLSKTAGHAFTAKLTLGGKAYPFSGVFSIDGY